MFHISMEQVCFQIDLFFITSKYYCDAKMNPTEIPNTRADPNKFIGFYFKYSQMIMISIVENLF